MPRYEGIRRRRFGIVLIALGAAGLVLVGYLLWAAYLETWRDVRAQARSQVELTEARFDAVLRRVDADLAYLAERLPQAALSKPAAASFRMSVEGELERFRRAFPEVAGFRVFDSEGDALYLSGGGDYVNVADRPYFIAHRDPAAPGIVFSDPLRSRITGRQALTASRAVRDADGKLRAVVSAAIETAYLATMLDVDSLGAAGGITIGRRDTLVPVLRRPEADARTDAASPVAERIAAGERSGESGVEIDGDGAARLVVFRVLPDYPFYVAAGIAEADAMAEWRRRALRIVGTAALFASGLAAMLAWLARLRRRELLAAAELDHRQGLLNAAQRIAQVGSWELDLASRRVTCSEELLRIFELSPVAEGFRYRYFAERVHPDDRAHVDAAMEMAQTTGKKQAIKHRLLMPDGRIKHVMEHCESEYAPDGTPLRLIGTTQDITGQHQLEAHMQLLVGAFEYSGEAIVITDRDNRIVAVNPAFTKLTGYSREEALGQDPKLLSAGRNKPEDYRQMWQALVERDFWQGEIWDKRKDGAVYPKWLSISVIRDDEGAAKYYVAHFTDVSAERATEAKLHHIAHHDVLTGLLNRFSLSGHLDQALAMARRNGTRVAVLFIDLDRFKVINDTLGHTIGDKLLIEVASRLRSGVRDSDVVARLGGDEFVVMLTGIEHSAAVATVAEKLVSCVAAPYTVGGHHLYTTPSIGIAIYPADGEAADVLLKNADAAMYHAKNAGRNNFQFFDPRMNDAVVARLSLEHALRQALKQDEFLLHFQPVIDVASGRVLSVEALVRWQHPEKGLLMPGAFIDIAEESGLIQPIGDWVFWAASRQLAAFRAAGIADVRVGINISVIQMRNGNLPSLVQGVLDAYGLDAGDLLLEVTESAAMDKPEQTIHILDRLHAMGVKLAIDDFGTGYSSLGYLRMFAIDYLKLDRSFVGEIGRGGDRSVICDATIGLAHNLGMRIVAEGVETAEQLAYLGERGCDMVQGYLFSRPLPADEIAEFIRARNG